MSITDPNVNDDEKTPTPEELEAMELNLLKERADLMKITYHPSVGAKTLRAKIAAALNDTTEPKQETPKSVVESPQEYRMRMRAEAHKLVRVVVTCMNPAKTSWEGEVFTVSNSIVGTARKFVPFNNDAGWHIPQIIYEQLLERKCQVFYTVTEPRTGMKTRKGKLINEFNVVVLPPLTKKELDELAAMQAATNSIDRE